MPKSCCAVGCHNHNMMKDRKVSFFTFPNKDTERRDRRINAVKRVNPDGSKWQPCKDAVLCQDHFISGKPNNKDPTHPDYIPTVFVYTETTTKEHEKRLKRKKKKKDKEKELSKMYENIASHASTSDTTDESRKIQVDKRTKAELAFEKAKEKKREQQILERASKTHKERIMEFNKHLDSLTEHFDIPKVSWTK